MFGVVLWSDPQERKAVIWCEDHGDLAYFDESLSCGWSDLSLDAGDLVSFDVHTDRDMRLARNPKVITEGLYRDLPATLGLNAPKRPEPKPKPTPQVPANGAQIIPFRPRRANPVEVIRKVVGSGG